MCKYCEEGKRGKFKGRKPDFIMMQDRFAVRIEKDEPYIGDYGLTVSDNEEAVEYTQKSISARCAGTNLDNKK